MKTGDWIVGIAFFVSGTVIYLSNYKRSDKKGRSLARVGMGIMIGGALLSVGQWMFNLAISGR